MKITITLLLLLSTSISFALPNMLIKKAIALPRAQTAQTQGLISAGIYCYNHHLSCSFVLTDTGGSAVQVLSIGSISLQTLNKSHSISFTAVSLHIKTQTLAQTIKTHPIAKELNTIYANGVPISFFPGGFFSPNQTYGYGLGITIQNPKNTKSNVKNLNAMDNLFNQTFTKVLKTKKPQYNMTTLANIPQALLHERAFQFFISAVRLNTYCKSINFSCSTAIANIFGTRNTLVSSEKIIPIFKDMSSRRASLSGMTGAGKNKEGYFPYPPGSPIFQNNKLIGGVGVTFMSMSLKPTRWRDYGTILENKYIQIYKQLHEKYS